MPTTTTTTGGVAGGGGGGVSGVSSASISISPGLIVKGGGGVVGGSGGGVAGGGGGGVVSTSNPRAGVGDRERRISSGSNNSSRRGSRAHGAHHNHHRGGGGGGVGISGGGGGGGVGESRSGGSRGRREIDYTLVAIALFVLIVLGLTEFFSSPRLVTRMSLALLWRFAHMFGVTEYYTLLAAWHGWYSLEIGVEIAAAVVTGFASWLLFALLYDTAGILVGLVPASMVTVVILIFRFHTRSWALVAALPMVFVPALACARFLDQRMQRAEEHQARARVLKMKAAAYSARGIHPHHNYAP